MTVAVLLRSGMRGNYHVPFCRAVEGATPSLTLIWILFTDAKQSHANDYWIDILYGQIDREPSGSGCALIEM